MSIGLALPGFRCVLRLSHEAFLALAVVLYERDFARADIGAGAALYTAVQAVGVQIVFIEVAAVQQQLLRQQTHRAASAQNPHRIRHVRT